MMELLYTIYRFFFARPFFRRFNYAMFRFGLSGMGVMNYRNERISGEFFLINTFLPKYIRTVHPVLFDVGANIGNFSKMLVQSFPDASIYSFEPHSQNFKHLKENISSKNVRFQNIALGESNGILSLYDIGTTDGSSHASIYKEVISEIHKQSAVSCEVSIVTLDDFAEKEGIEFIDYLKIDTEGNELSVLKGATALLKNEKIGFIHFEFNEMNVISRVFLRDFRTILTNYNLYRLLPNGLLILGDDISQTELFAFQNILAIPKTITIQ
ncbi:MAG: FkbM family methyltransferase [Bacteroidota bacterium]|nr:FkbM family methyltransferase [Bacteroidota bacterium]